jgi:hypothetical protein
MSLHIPIRKNSPLSRMLPSIIPSRFGELRARTVDSFNSSCITDTVVIWCNPHNGTILLVQLDIVMFELAMADTVEVPEIAEARPEWSWDIL